MARVPYLLPWYVIQGKNTDSVKNPGEIFILLKDELMGEILEVEFISDNKCLRTRPARWSKSVWCLKAADFPPGSVTVNIHCDGIIKATTEIKYCSAAKATESPFRMSEPGKSLDQAFCFSDGDLGNISGVSGVGVRKGSGSKTDMETLSQCASVS
ncbi:B cell scaffold protein with ankyrin repeats 1 [Cricetulus griseus]